jgi:Uma2 family endonuclease
MATAEPNLLPPSKSMDEALSAREFLDWLEPDIHADLIGGEIFMHSPVSLKHARLLNFVDLLLRLYLSEHQLGELFREVVAVRLSERNVFLPDLCFFSNDQIPLLEPNCAPIAPKLTVEVLSPSSATRDFRQKFSAYEEHGVEEYWILDPEEHRHRFYRRDGALLKEYAVGDEKIEATTIPDFFLRRSWLNQPAFPDVKVCLTEILAARGR